MSHPNFLTLSRDFATALTKQGVTSTTLPDKFDQATGSEVVYEIAQRTWYDSTTSF